MAAGGSLITPEENANWRRDVFRFCVDEDPEWRYETIHATKTPSSCVLPRLGELRVGDFVVCELDAESGERCDDVNDGSAVMRSCEVVLQIRGFNPAEKDNEVHALRCYHASETIVGSTSLGNEIFSSRSCTSISVKDISRRVVVKRTKAVNTTLQDKVFVLRKLYDPTNCSFLDLKETEKNASLPCPGCKQMKDAVLVNEKTLVIGQQRISVNDVVFLAPDAFGEQTVREEQLYNRSEFREQFGNGEMYPEFWRQNPDFQGRGTFQKVAPVMELGIVERFNPCVGDNGRVSWHVLVQKLIREKNLPFGSRTPPDPNGVYLTGERCAVAWAKVIKRVEVFCPQDPLQSDNTTEDLDKLRDDIVLVLKGGCSEETSFEVRPVDVDLREHFQQSYDEYKAKVQKKIRPLRTMDLFGGVGGLSYGLGLSGAVDIRWAVESDPNAARAFKVIICTELVRFIFNWPHNCLLE